MSTDKGSSPRFPFLEGVTAAVLVLVMLSLGWMLLAAFQPALSAEVPLSTQVGVVVALLSTALVLVSLVALLHTRPGA